MIEIKKGDIFYADLSSVTGSEQDGIRPVIIIQNNILNKRSSITIVASITSRAYNIEFPTHVKISSEECNLCKDSTILFEQIRVIDKKRLKEKIGKVPKSLFNVIDNALCIIFDIKNIEQSKEDHILYIQQILQLENYIHELTKPLVITEGKTDVRIIRTAWMKLYPDKDMPFACEASGINPNEDDREGNADTVRRTIEYMSAISNKPIIGIFDNDRGGNEQFRGLNKNFFEKYDIKKNIRKHNSKNVWAILLPVPDKRKNFVTNNDITQRYFVIEHYFSDDVLRKHLMYGNSILGTSVFKVNNRKDEFSKEIKKLDPKEFVNFKLLFSQILEILNIKL